MSRPWASRRTLVLLGLLPLLALLAFVALRSGPMAPVTVTEEPVRQQALRPQLSGIGTVEARQVFRIGPTVAGRVRQVMVDVGEQVRSGQWLGEMDPVDLDERIRAQAAAQQRAQASVREAQARQAFAAQQVQRYSQLWAAQATTEESLATRQQELAVADAALAALRQELARVQADEAALRVQRGHLRLLAPQDGLVLSREVEPGSTVLAGQTVLELAAVDSLWVHLRLDQVSAQGLTVGLPASITLRSRPGEPLAGQVLRLEPKADAVTEETLAKVLLQSLPTPAPPLGELAEVTLQLPALPATAVIPAAAVQRQGQQRGVWQRQGDAVRFVPLTLGRADLEGRVQVLQGLQAGDAVIVYSEKPLTARSRVRVVERLIQAAP